MTTKFLALLSVLAVLVSFGVRAQNMLPNEGFASPDQQTLPGWRRAIGWSGKSLYSWQDGVARIVHPEDDNGAGAFISERISVVAGKAYAFSVEGRGTAVEHADLSMNWLDSSGKKLGYVLLDRQKGTFGWKILRGVATAPEGAAGAVVMLVVGSGGTMEFRHPFMQEGTRFRPIAADGNLLANCDFSRLTGGYPDGWTPALGWAGKSEYAVEGDAVVIRRTEAGSGAGAFISVDAELSGSRFVQVGVEIKTAGLSGSGRIMVQFVDKKGKSGISIPVGQLDRNADWTSFSKTILVPADAVAIKVFLILNGKGVAAFRKPYAGNGLPALPSNVSTAPCVLNGSFENADLNESFADCYQVRHGAARRVAKAVHGYHGLELQPGSEVTYGNGQSVPVSVMAGEKLEFSIAALGSGTAEAVLEYVSADGNAVGTDMVSVKAADDVWRTGRKTVTIPVTAQGARLAMRNTGAGAVVVDALHLGPVAFDGAGVLSVPVVDVPYDAAASAAYLPSEVKERHGVPTWFIDGEPMNGAMFTYSNLREGTSKSWYGYERKCMRLGQFPVTLVSVSLSSHPRNTKYTMEQALADIDFQVQAGLAEMPDARFILWFFLEGCQDFADEYPGETIVTEQPELPWSDGIPPYSYGSEVWGRLCARRTAELLREVSKKPYAKHIVGISPGMGRYGENNWGHAGVVGGATPNDFSPAMQNFFRIWLFSAYGGDVGAFQRAWNTSGRFNFTNAFVPGSQVRLVKSQGSLYGPKTDRQTLDYIRCESHAVLHRVLEQCEAAKKATDGKIFTFTQFGYFSSWMYHREFAVAMDNPYLDAVGPAPAYINRGPGDDILDHAPSASVQAHGKVWLFQADVRTHLADYHNWRYGRTQNEDESIGVFLRDMGHYMATGTIPYYMSFEQWYASPRMWDMVSRFQEYMELAACFQQQAASEIAVVVDSASLALGFEYNYVTRLMSVQQSALEYNRTFEWHRLGTPYDFYMLDDLLASPKLNQYKVVVFAVNSVVSDEQRSLIEERLHRDGRTLVWMYTPGIVRQSGTVMDMALKHVSEVTGFGVTRDDKRRDLSIKLADGRVFGRFTTDIYGGFTMPTAPRKVRRESYTPSLNVIPGDGIEVFGTYENDGAPAAAVCRHDGWTDVFWGSTALNKEVLLPILDKAGVHTYADAPAVVYANGNFVVVHSPIAGRREIRLPRRVECVYDLYARRELTADTDRVVFDFYQNGTALLYFGARKALADAQRRIAAKQAARRAANAARQSEFTHELTRKPPQGKAADVMRRYRPDEDGFIRHWLVLAPLPNYEREGIAMDFLKPEATCVPKAGDALDVEFDGTPEKRQIERRGWFDGEKRKITLHTAWKPVEFSKGVIKAFYDEFSEKDLPFSDNIVYYLSCTVIAPEERKVVLGIGSDDNEKCWLNGTLVTQCNFASRGCKPDSETALVTLKTGENTLLLKVAQGGGGVGHAVRFLDPQTGLPITSLQIALRH